MAPQQRIKVANEKASKNITLRGNVPKSTVSILNVIPYGITIELAKQKLTFPSPCFCQKLYENHI